MLRPVSVLFLLLPFLPACAVSIGSGKETRETTWPVTSESPEVASVPFAGSRKPGVTVKLNPVSELPTKVAETPTVETPKEFPPIALPPAVIATSPDGPLVGIVRAYVDGKPESAGSFLQSFDKPNQELIQQMVPALVKASQLNTAQPDAKELSAITGPLAAVMFQLNKRAPLSVEKAVFCRSVKNFGRYEAMPENPMLKPGANMIYVELGNISSEPATQNFVPGYLTRLTCTMKLTDAANAIIPITSKDETNKERLVDELIVPKSDFSQSPLRDYFLQMWFTAPSKPGQYTVHFKVRDPLTNREVARALPFRVP